MWTFCSRRLFLSVAAAMAVRDIAGIFITPASKSRQTADSALVVLFHFSDLEFITQRMRAPLCAFVIWWSPADIDYFWQTACVVGFFCRPSWQRYRNVPMKHCNNQSSRNNSVLPLRCFTTKPLSSARSVFTTKILRSLCIYTDWVEFNYFLFFS